MNRLDIQGMYQWLQPGYRTVFCAKCKGAGQGCMACSGTGRGAPVFSRTDVIRREQVASGHRPCYGVAGKSRAGDQETVTPSSCGEAECRYRRSCEGLHLKSRYHSDLIREESIEYLSRLFLNARAIERRSAEWTPFQADLANLMQQWSDDTPQVAVLGAFSAGKSTLLNRLLGKSILPATRTPTTAVVTSIRYDNHAHGVLYYRNLARLTLLSQDARGPDSSAVQAMQAWTYDPDGYGISAILEVDELGTAVEVDRTRLLAELDALTYVPEQGERTKNATLKRVIGRRDPLPIEQFTRTFEVHFVEREPQDIKLENDSDIAEFGRHLTESSLALTLARAVFYLPDTRLQSLNFLDTAGLCSPVGFHKDVTIELLKRRPDKILVLLDARRLDSPTNREALKVLGRFVSVPDDYRQVTFALTFWDYALRTHMVEDSEPELEFESPTERSVAGKRFAKSKREELSSLLSSSVGVECQLEPVIFTLGLGVQAPPEMRKTLDELWRHLESDCRGWVGVQMWAERWRAIRAYSTGLLELHKETVDGIEEAVSAASDTTDLDAQLVRLDAQERAISGAFKRAENSLIELVEAQKQRMLAEVACLDSKSSILSYLDDGYWISANMALDTLQDESKRINRSITELRRGAKALRLISLDRKLLGLDVSVREKAKGNVTGVMYGLKSIWDFLFGGVIELNEENRAAAREILQSQVRGTIDLLADAVDVWRGQAKRISQQAYAEYSSQRNSLFDGKSDSSRYVEGLKRRLRFLSNSKQRLDEVCAVIDVFADSLGQANTRIQLSRLPDFNVVLCTDVGEWKLRKGREQDLLLLPRLRKMRWTCLEIRSSVGVSRFFPVVNGRVKSVRFVEGHVMQPRKREPFWVPEGASRFELRLSTLEGRFVFDKRQFANVLERGMLK